MFTLEPLHSSLYIQNFFCLTISTNNSILAPPFSILLTKASNMENISDNMTTQARRFTDGTASSNKRQGLNDGEINAGQGRHTETRGETVDEPASGALESDDVLRQAETAKVKDEVSQTQIP
jgi:hypothetical protein